MWSRGKLFFFYIGTNKRIIVTWNEMMYRSDLGITEKIFLGKMSNPCVTSQRGKRGR